MYVKHWLTAPRRTSTASQQSDFEARVQKLAIGEWLSEACLWCRWQHCGESTPRGIVSVLKVNAAQFGDVIQKYNGAFILSCQQAAYFVDLLNTMRLPTDYMTSKGVMASTVSSLDFFRDFRSLRCACSCCFFGDRSPEKHDDEREAELRRRATGDWHYRGSVQM